ncbi:MAG: Ig-like domain-containing protein [Oscillospiraceae bacterium]|nr:Ig-like domain-containing protein [Oscillospiraceae bacterium]
MSNIEERSKREILEKGREVPNVPIPPTDKKERRLDDKTLTEMAEQKLAIYLEQYSIKDVAAMNPDIEEDMLKELLIETFKDEADEEASMQMTGKLSDLIMSGDRLERELEFSIVDYGLRPQELIPRERGLGDLVDKLRPIRPFPMYLSLISTDIELGSEMEIRVIHGYINDMLAPSSNVTWRSSNPAVATVHESGKYKIIYHPIFGFQIILVPGPTHGIIKGLSLGTATISAQHKVNGYIASVDITVQILPKSLTIVKEGETRPRSPLFVSPYVPLQLEAIVLPENATDKTVYWSSSAPEVVNVTENGLVTTTTPYVNGITIYARTKVGGLVDSVQLTMNL